MNPDVLLWFKNYFCGRVHRVKHSGNFSEWRSMKGRVPRGGALGPLLFLIYVNDLPSQVTGGLLLQYADDTTLICRGSSNSDVAVIMNHQLELISQWTLTNKMRLNHSKSSVVWCNQATGTMLALFLCRIPLSLGWLLIGVNENFLVATNHKSGAHLEQRHTLKFNILYHSACQQWFIAQTTCDVHVLSCLNFQLLGQLF